MRNSKWHGHFPRPSDSWAIDQNIQNIILINYSWTIFDSFRQFDPECLYLDCVDSFNICIFFLFLSPNILPQCSLPNVLDISSWAWLKFAILHRTFDLSWLLLQRHCLCPVHMSHLICFPTLVKKRSVFPTHSYKQHLSTSLGINSYILDVVPQNSSSSDIAVFSTKTSCFSIQSLIYIYDSNSMTQFQKYLCSEVICV